MTMQAPRALEGITTAGTLTLQSRLACKQAHIFSVGCIKTVRVISRFVLRRGDVVSAAAAAAAAATAAAPAAAATKATVTRRAMARRRAETTANVRGVTTARAIFATMASAVRMTRSLLI